MRASHASVRAQRNRMPNPGTDQPSHLGSDVAVPPVPAIHDPPRTTWTGAIVMPTEAGKQTPEHLECAAKHEVDEAAQPQHHTRGDQNAPAPDVFDQADHEHG